MLQQQLSHLNGRKVDRRQFEAPYMEFLLSILYNNSVRTSEETHYISATKSNQLMLFREKISIYFENQIHSVGRTQEFQYVKAGRIYSKHWVLKYYILGEVINFK
jgi:hypothetical protein